MNFSLSLSESKEYSVGKCANYVAIWKIYVGDICLLLLGQKISSLAQQMAFSIVFQLEMYMEKKSI